MNVLQYAIIAKMLPDLTDTDLETLRKAIEQLQDARRADKLLDPVRKDDAYVR